MSTLYVALLTAYVLHALLANRHGDDPPSRSTKRVGAALNTPLFLMALYLAAQQGVLGRQLVSPLHFLAGLLGYVLYTEFNENYGGYRTSVLLIFGLSWMVAMALAAVVFTLGRWKPERLAREHAEAEDELLV